MDSGAPERKKTSPWVYIGCGCGALVVLAMAGIAGMTWISYREAKKLEKSWTDPAEAAARTRAVLAYDKLPEGYYPMGTFSLPFVMDMAMIGDDPPAPGKKQAANPGGFFKERGFIFMKMRGFGRRSREVREYMEGKGEQPEWMRGNTAVDTDKFLRRGEVVDANGHKVLYSATIGEVSQSGHRHDGIATMLEIACPQDKRVRFGIWFGPEPKPGESAGEVDFSGTNADPKEIQRFASHFRFCPAGK